MSNWKVGDTSFEEFFDNEQIFIIPPDSPSVPNIDVTIDSLQLDESYLILENGDFINHGEPNKIHHVPPTIHFNN
jgi:hypothetical protein